MSTTTIVNKCLICPICLMKFTNPYINIPCGHTFCKTCIDGSDKQTLNCPICRTSTTHLMKNFIVANLLNSDQTSDSEPSGTDCIISLVVVFCLGVLSYWITK